MAQRLEGKAVVAAMAAELSERVRALKEKGVQPTLAILRMGERPEDLSYERAAAKRCAQLGIELRSVVLPEDASTEQLLSTVDWINQDGAVHGCLPMRPFPAQIDERAVCERLSARKDMDGVGDRSLAAVFTGRGEGFCPCTAQACVELLRHYGVQLRGKRAVVIGRSLVVGKPLAMLLTARDATVTLCHSRTEELAAICREADILVAAVGSAGMVDERFVRPGQVLVDVGVNVDDDGRLCGDLCFDRVEPIVEAISPVPGGVGGVTSMVLCKHVIEAAEKAALEIQETSETE